MKEKYNTLEELMGNFSFDKSIMEKQLENTHMNIFEVYTGGNSHMNIFEVYTGGN
ncbi:MAG: hypothetical protein VW298_02605 [Candidatus Woesearchaeota archaeon]